MIMKWGILKQLYNHEIKVCINVFHEVSSYIEQLYPISRESLKSTEQANTFPLCLEN